MITHEDIGSDENAARRILVRARDIAPCLDSLEGERRKDAIAILKGVFAELPEPGSGRVRSLSRNGTALTYADIESAFTTEAIAGLRSLCGTTPTGAARGSLPIGSFPESDIIARTWPEGNYS